MCKQGNRCESLSNGNCRWLQVYFTKKKLFHHQVKQFHILTLVFFYWIDTHAGCQHVHHFTFLPFTLESNFISLFENGSFWQVNIFPFAAIRICSVWLFVRIYFLIATQTNRFGWLWFFLTYIYTGGFCLDLKNQ